MLDQILIIASLIFFLVVGLVFKTRKFDSIGEFTITKNKLKWFPIAAGISMTFAGGAALLNMASLGYTFGWYTLVDPLALIGGILIVLIFIKAYQQDNGVTISNLLSKSDRKLSVLIGIITSVVFILILAAQFVALSKLLSPYFTLVHPLILTTVLSAAIFSYVFFVLPIYTYAVWGWKDSLVPGCGGKPCGYTELLTLLSNIIDFGVLLAPILAVLAFIYAGFQYVTAGGEESKISEAHKIFLDAVIGLIIVFVAYFLIKTILTSLGVEDWANLLG